MVILWLGQCPIKKIFSRCMFGFEQMLAIARTMKEQEMVNLAVCSSTAILHQQL